MLNFGHWSAVSIYVCSFTLTTGGARGRGLSWWRGGDDWGWEVWTRSTYFDLGWSIRSNSPSRLLLMCLYKICSLLFPEVWLLPCPSFPCSRLSGTDGAAWNQPAVRGCGSDDLTLGGSTREWLNSVISHVTATRFPNLAAQKDYLGSFAHLGLWTSFHTQSWRSPESRTQEAFKTPLGNSAGQPSVDHCFNWFAWLVQIEV